MIRQKCHFPKLDLSADTCARACMCNTCTRIHRHCIKRSERAGFRRYETFAGQPINSLECKCNGFRIEYTNFIHSHVFHRLYHSQRQKNHLLHCLISLVNKHRFCPWRSLQQSRLRSFRSNCQKAPKGDALIRAAVYTHRTPGLRFALRARVLGGRLTGPGREIRLYLGRASFSVSFLCIRTQIHLAAVMIQSAQRGRYTPRTHPRVTGTHGRYIFIIHHAAHHGCF